jgi:glycosyltransferase involved in cell wall biosynthesis
MRILIVSEDIPYPSMGGLAKHALNLARALVRAGHQVDLLGGDQHPLEAAGEDGKFGGRFFGELSAHHAGWKELRLGAFLPPRRTWLARRFARIILRHAANYDVIHYHGHVPNVARFIPDEVNFVQTRHDQGSDCLIDTRFRNGAICNATDPAECANCRSAQPNFVQRAVSSAAVVRFRREVAAGFRRHKTVFVSEMLRRNLTRTLGPGKWGVVMHNFTDAGAIERARVMAETPPPDEYHVFIAAKLHVAKGVEPFLRQVVTCLPPGMVISVAGDGGQLARLRAEFADEQIRFLGWCTQEHTLALAARAHAVVVPSIWEEPCASTILEGLALGKPVFALALGGTPELTGYAGSAGQLRLHKSMPLLVEDLVRNQPHPVPQVPGARLADADHAAAQLLALYRAPRRSPDRVGEQHIVLADNNN